MRMPEKILVKKRIVCREKNVILAWKTLKHSNKTNLFFTCQKNLFWKKKFWPTKIFTSLVLAFNPSNDKMMAMTDNEKINKQATEQFIDNIALT